MILLLLTSALALSFVPLTSNDLPVATISAVAFAPATRTLTATFTCNEAGTTIETHTFRIAVYAGESDGEVLFSATLDKAKLTVAASTADVVIEMNEKVLDLEAIHVDILAKLVAAPNTEATIATARSKVTFVDQPESVAVTKNADDATKVDIAVTFAAGFATDLSTSKFVVNGKEYTPTKAELVYTAIVPHAELLEAPSTIGYFKGTDLAKSTLPISLFAVPVDLALAPTSLVKVTATFTGAPTEANRVWLQVGSAAATALTLTSDACDIEYTKLVSAKIYYTTTDGIMSSMKKDISLAALEAPEQKEFLAVVDSPPSINVKFEKAVTGRKLVVVKADDTVSEVDVGVNTVVPVASAKLVGKAAYFIVAHETDAAQTLILPFEAATFTQAKGELADGEIPMAVEMTPGFYPIAPTGILVNAKDATDLANHKFYTITWDQTDAEKGSATVDIADFKPVRDKKIESFVAGKVAEADPVKLSAAEPVMDEVVTTFVTVKGVTFIADGIKLKVTIKSDADVSTTALGSYRIAVFDAATGANELFEKTFTKAELTGADKDVEVAFEMDAKLNDLKTLYVDVFETLPEKDEESMISTPRKEAVFAAKKADVAISSAASGTDSLKFTITLDSALATPITEKFVFKGKKLDVAAGTGDNVYEVIILLADLLEADSTTGYFLGDALLTTTLPISLFAVNPAVALAHTDLTKTEATFTGVPEGNKVWLKSGTDAATELTLAENKCDIDYAKLANAIIYYTDAEGALKSNKKDISLDAFTAPEYEWVLEATEEDNDAPKIIIKFAKSGTNRYIVIPTVTEPVAIEDKENEFTLAQLVAADAYYIVYDKTTKVPATRPLAIPAATLVQAKTAEASGKIPVTVTVEVGLLEAEPTGILVHAEGEAVADKMKYYALTWGITTETVHKATAQVPVADFADLTAKNIESYVANKAGTAAPKKIEAAPKLIVIPKKEDPGKDEGAFGQIVSIMTVLLSLFVFAL